MTPKTSHPPYVPDTDPPGWNWPDEVDDIDPEFAADMSDQDSVTEDQAQILGRL